MRRHIELGRPDGIQDQYETIQSALNGGNLILDLPPGIFPVSRTLKVFSHTTIRATEKTVIRRMDHTANDIDDCLIANENTGEDKNSSIELDGGIWDLNNAANPRGNDKEKSFWGVALRFDNVDDLIIHDLTVANPETYFIRLCRVNHFRILNIRLFAAFPAANQDGIHLNGFCFNGVIRGVHAVSPLTPNDDMIAFNAFDGPGYQNHGIELGPIENIEVEDIYAESAYGFFRFLTKEPAQYIRNIRIRNCRGGVRYLFLNANHFADAAPGEGVIENVEFSNISVHKLPVFPGSKEYLHPLWGLQLHMENVVIRDVERPLLDVGCAIPTFNLHPLCGTLIAYEPDLLNTAELCKNKKGETILPCGGFRLLKIGSPSKS